MARDSKAQFAGGEPNPGEGLPPEQVPATGSIRRDGSPSPSPGGEGDGVTPFDIGDLLAGRYKIKRFLGRGGMGEVFEVEDLVLHAIVALKTIHPKEADRAGAIDRFKREINVARRVTHPNVCRLFDVGSHQSTGADGKVRDTLFLTMELLEGENLADRINRGRLAIEEALPILVGMAQGLDAAHRAGVLHRDFKAANVMLATARESKRLRAVVTDFGLARTLEREDGAASLSDSGVVVGTPAYMSPEQVRGDTLTSASDIYAMGLVLYEMVTGQRPFAGGSAWSIAVKRLTQEPPNPRAVVPDLDPRWEVAINACLQIEPEKRPRTAEEVVEMVRSEPPLDETKAIRSSPGTTPKAPAAIAAAGRHWSRDRRVWAAALGLAGLLATGLLMSRRSADVATKGGSETTAPAEAPAIVARTSVLVLPVASTGEKEGSIGTAVGEVARASLASNGTLRVLPADEAQRAIRDLGLAGGTPSAGTLNQLRALLGIDYVVAGAASALPGGDERLIRLEVSLFDARTGQRVAQSSATGAESSLPDLARRAQEGSRKKLGLGDTPGEAAAQIEASWPGEPEASRLCAVGLANLRGNNAADARDAFERAVTLAPDHPVPHAGLARALASLGYVSRAGEEAAATVRLTERLAPEDKLWTNAHMQGISGDWGAAAQSYRALLDLAPDNLDYGLRLAESQISGGRATQALDTLAALRRLPEPLSSDPRIDLAAAQAHGAVGDAKQQLDFATRAAQGAAARRSRLTEGWALMNKSVAQERLGDRAAGVRSSEQAYRLFEAAGDARSAVLAIESTAASTQASGDLEGARRLYERTVAVHEKSGDRAGRARALQNLASIAHRQGDRKKADRLDAESIAIFREIGARAYLASTLNNIAMRLHTAGDLKAAQQKYTEAIATFGDIGDRSGQAQALGNVAEVLLARGELKDAEGMLEEAVTTWRELADSSNVAYVLGKLGDLAALRGDLLVARGRYDDALKTQQTLKEGLSAAETRLGLARLSLWADKPAEAETFAREAEEVLRSEKAADGQMVARSLLAEALLAQGKLAEAREAAAPLAATAPQSRDASVRTAFALAGARLQAASGDIAGALAVLEKARKAAVADKLRDHELRLVLAAGEIEIKNGREKAGRARLEALAKGAEAQGFGLFVRKARELAK